MNISSLYPTKPNPNVAQVSPGDTVKVSFKIKEASKERLQVLSGLIIGVKKGKNGGNFTIRRVVSGVGVEHTIPFASPLLEKVEVVRHGKVRRAKLYYIRRLSTKEARLKERRENMVVKDKATILPVDETLATAEPAGQEVKDSA
jgi:large subunit ribosomal protein L19